MLNIVPIDKRENVLADYPFSTLKVGFYGLSTLGPETSVRPQNGTPWPYVLMQIAIAGTLSYVVTEDTTTAGRILMQKKAMSRKIK